MDFATRLLQWRQLAPEHWARAANRYLPPAVSALLILALAWQAAKLTWALIPGVPADAPSPVVSPIAPEESAGTTPTIDITRIMDSDLFGAVSSEPVEPVAVSVLEAPETTLNLQLKATVADTLENRRGAAIIASGQVEQTYTVSDVIEGAGGAQLHAIYNDRVILNRAGRLETLRLPTEYASGNVGAVYAAPVMPTPVESTLRSVISDNATRINEIVRVAAHIEQGRMLGFRLNPGEQPEQFAALGFQPGDVVTEINGTAMSDPSRGLQVFESLGESTMANVTVVRDGAPQVLTIDTTLLGELDAAR
jgi:general secretion pathway protein C